MTVRIVTDSGCDLSPSVANEHGVTVVPLSIRFGADEFTDRVDLTPQQFYEKMEASNKLPETAAPAPGAFEQAFSKLFDEGANAVVSINLSEALSATAQSARTAASTLPDRQVRVVDSKSVSVGLGTLVLKAAKMAQEGADASTIVGATQELAERTHVLGVLDTLDNLKKGGRIGNAQALMGAMLSIKPCIDLSSGVVEEAGRQRTRKKALAWLYGSIPSEATDVAVAHGLVSDIDTIVDSIPNEVARVSIVGPVIGTHGGPRLIGASYIDPS